MNQALRPVAPPQVIEGVYTEDQHRRLLEVVQNKGPWPSLISHHFDTVDEMIATVNGIVPEGHGLTLDDVAGPLFRGFYGQNSVCYHPEIHDCFYNERFLDLVKDYWGVPYAKPTMMLFNLGGPNPELAPPPPHLDAVTFRGGRYENAPVWLQNVMGKSGLFTDYLVKMGQVITWWYLGENGTFTYWPDGPMGQPKVLEHPLWNKGVVVQNEMMFHRGDPVGPYDGPPIEGLKNRSMMGYDQDADLWRITTDDETVHTYQPNEMRFMVHWNAELYEDMDELKKVMDHTDDLTIDEAIGRLLMDMRSKGTKIADPSDPFHDTDFVRALVETYTIAPTTEWLSFPAA
ncbi:hypothetical protein BH10ACT3_BH10ACT3_12880 [soil metagenome]